MKIIIEVADGCVQYIYGDGSVPINIEILVVDTDPGDVGDPVVAQRRGIDPIENAPLDVMDAITRVTV